MCNVNSFLVVVFSMLLMLHIEEVLSHGMLVNPVSRGSMWREGYPTTVNYDDGGNNCGGYDVLWNVNHGKCGACGDDYSLPQPRPNENTGTYGAGIVVAKYKAGSLVPLTVQINTNLGGFFIFSICPLTDGPDQIEQDTCFDQYQLHLEAAGAEGWSLENPDRGNYTIIAKLPDSLTCDRCVLRWHWYTATKWGPCTDTTSKEIVGAGCGPQEMFRTCSDITII